MPEQLGWGHYKSPLAVVRLTWTDCCYTIHYWLATCALTNSTIPGYTGWAEAVFFCMFPLVTIWSHWHLPTDGSRGPLCPQDVFKIMQFSGNFLGKPPILSKFWAQGPPGGQNSTGPPSPKSWIRACSLSRHQGIEHLSGGGWKMSQGAMMENQNRCIPLNPKKKINLKS